VFPVLEKLRELWEKSPVVRKGKYRYVVHPITDGIPYLEPDLLDDIVKSIMEIANLDVDYIVTPEAMGIPIGVLLSNKTKIPLNIIRKKKYSLDGELEAFQKTGYLEGKMYINGLRAGDRILLVDDIVSTGGTLSGIIKALQEGGIIISDIVIVLERGEGREYIRRITGREVKTLLKVKDR